MPLDPDLVAPQHTAVVLHELQRSTVGDRSTLPQLVEAAAPAVAAASRLVLGARAAGVEIVHCVAASRPDFKGSSHNTVFTKLAQREAATHPRSATDLAEAAEVVPDISVDPADIVLSRLHGMSAFNDSGLDTLLRNMGVHTVVACGVSLNVGVMGLVIEAVNRGYDVVLAADATAGVPPSYGEAVIKNTLSLITRVTTVDDLLAIWG